MGFCVIAYAIQRILTGKIVKNGENRAYRTLRGHERRQSGPGVTRLWQGSVDCRDKSASPDRGAGESCHAGDR